MHGETTRRTLLRAVGAAGAAGTAGCLDALPDFGDGSGGTDAAKWLYERGTVYENADDYDVRVAHPAAIDSRDEDGVAEFYGYLTHAYWFGDYLGLDWQALDTVALWKFSIVARGEYDVDEVSVTLAENGFESDGSYAGYDLFVGTDATPDFVVGIDGTHAIIADAAPETSADTVFRTTVDTRDGSARRQVDASDDTALLADRLFDRDIAQAIVWQESPFEQEPWASQTARGYGYAVDGTETELEYHLVHPAGSEVPVDGYREWLDGRDEETLYGIADATVEQRGRTAVVSGTVATADLDPPFDED